MIRVIQMFKVANKFGAEFVQPREKPKRYVNRESAQREADRLNVELVAPNWLRAFPCFMLEVPQEKGPSLHFDLNNPIDIVE